MSLAEILARGGYIVWILGVVSVILVALIVERALSYRKYRYLKIILNQAKETLDINTLLQLEAEYGGDLLRKLTTADKEESETLLKATKQELERHLAGIATIASIAPLLGFLGTVTGMIKAFMQIQRLGGNVNPSVLAGGIWEALVTTAVGLAIAIPAVAFYNWFVARGATIYENVEELIRIVGHHKDETRVS